MQVSCRWQSGLKFLGSAGENQIVMDAKSPLGTNAGMTPKELVVAGLCGCTAMDVAALMKKHKQQVDDLAVIADVTTSAGVSPVVFTAVALNFQLSGQIDAKTLLEAVHLSQTKYCGVSAMLALAFPITYTVELNGETIGDGKAEFSR